MYEEIPEISNDTFSNLERKKKLLLKETEKADHVSGLITLRSVNYF